jgi:DNA-binding transcriptional MerR regulator
MTPREFSISDVARLAGTTSRTLRHYGDVGLLRPSRVAASGHRYYDAAALTRLQRILLLRELGLGIPAIADVLAGQRDDLDALGSHLLWLEGEKSRLDRQVASVKTTIRKLREGKPLMAEEMFDGFDHTVYREEVEERWGADEYRAGDAWWRSLSAAERVAHREQHDRIAADYATARAAGLPVGGDDVRAIVARHRAWLGAASAAPIGPERLRGYGDLYVGDPRFADNYGGLAGAEYVRAALYAWAADERSGGVLPA